MITDYQKMITCTCGHLIKSPKKHHKVKVRIEKNQHISFYARARKCERCGKTYFNERDGLQIMGKFDKLVKMYESK